MALTVEQLAYLRSEVGPGVPPSDDDLEAALVRLGSVEAVALEVVKGRLAALADVEQGGPGSLAVEGYSQSTSANLAALAKQAEQLRKQVNGDVVITPLVRQSPTR